MANNVEFEPWFQAIWNWVGAEIFNFGIRWVVAVSLAATAGYFFSRVWRSQLRRDIDAVMSHIGLEPSGKKEAKKLVSWMRASAPTPKTKTWINRKDALVLIGKSSIAMRNSPRRKKPAKTAFQKMLEQSTSGPLTRVVEPSGEDIYNSKLEREVTTGLLYQIIKKHPEAEKGDKYSQEIIVFELCQMAVKSSAGHDI